MAEKLMGRRAGQIWYDVKARDVAESNLFLRRLWATLRRRVGPHPWLFTPRKDGTARTVSFGRASFPDGKVVEFGISYRQRGVINRLWLRPEAGSESLLPEIDASVHEAKGNLSPLLQHWVTTEIELFPPVNFSSYRSKYLKLQGLTEGRMRLELYISGYDESDRRDHFLTIAASILDALSVFTNCSYRYAPSSTQVEIDQVSNVRWASDDWLDDSPVIDGRLAISQEQLRYLDKFATNPSDDALVRAARLFHEALHLEYSGPASLNDATRALYLSALEAATAPKQDPSTCGECGQPVHSIRSRVRDTARKYLGEPVEHIIDRAYKNRSGYLHIGSVLGSRPYSPNSGPLLDPDGVSGCYLHPGMGNTNNIREFTSFILRELAREH